MTRVQPGKAGIRPSGERTAKAPARKRTQAPARAGAGQKAASRARREAPVAAMKDAELDRLLQGFELGNIVSHLLRRAHFRAEEIFSQQAGERLKLTPRQKALLVSCYRNPGSNQSALAERIALDPNTAAEMVSRMVRTGLLVRSRDPDDARSNRVHITASGIRMLKAIMPVDPVIESLVVEPLPPEYRPLFLKCLRLMVGLGAVGPDGRDVDSAEGPG
jgi:DNA-binding MarR family transcriptional regulator